MLPSGYIFRMEIHASHGCQYYVGLNGLELYDDSGCCVELTRQNLVAVPESINTLAEVTTLIFTIFRDDARPSDLK